MPRPLSFPLAAFALLLLTGCPAGPKDAASAFYTALNEKKYDTAFELLSKESQELFDPKQAVEQAMAPLADIPDEETRKQEIAAFKAAECPIARGKTWAEVEQMTAGEYFAAVISQKQGDETYGGEIVSESIDTEKDTATVKTSTREGDKDLKLVKEDGAWKISLVDG